MHFWVGGRLDGYREIEAYQHAYARTRQMILFPTREQEKKLSLLFDVGGNQDEILEKTLVFIL